MNIELKQIPFVDGKPAEGQEKLKWIQNGEQLTGSDVESGNDGNLNLIGVQIQKNIDVLVENDSVLLSALNDNNTKISNIESILNESVDLSIFEQLSQNKESLIEIQGSVEALSSTAEKTKENIESIKNEIGEKTIVSGNRNIIDDLDFIKSRIGSFANENVNGEIVEGVEDSGLIKKVNDSLKQTVSNTNEIREIKNKIGLVDLSELNSDVDKIKINLGTKPENFEKSIYERIVLNSENILSNENKLNELVESIGEGSINKRVSDLETSYLEQDEEIKSLQSSANEFNEDVAEINLKLNSVGQNFLSMFDLIGSTNESGIRGDVNALKQTIGDEQSPGETTIKGRLNSIESKQSLNSASLQEIEIQLGDVNSGIIKDVSNASKAINGNVQSSNAVEKAGLMKTTKNLYESNELIINSINSIVSKQNYNGKKFVLMSDGNLNSTSNIGAVIASKLNASSNQSIFANGIDEILMHNDFTDSLKADVILVNVGSVDSSGSSMNLGSIADAKSSYEGNGSFYNSVFKLLFAVVKSSYNPRVFISNGILTNDDYCAAIKEVAKMFSVPVLDTKNELGISEVNIQNFVDENVLNTLGATRFINYVSGSINSK